MNLRTKIRLSFSIALILLCLISYFLFISGSRTLPIIQGVIIPQSKSMLNFSIIDHNNQTFTNQRLIGKWHLVSYGYTHCPDICPATLNVLSKFFKELELEGKQRDLGVLFYSIDYKRDTAEHLAQYVPFFHDEFIGLTHLGDSESDFLAFEKSMGMKSLLSPLEEKDKSRYSGSYTVAHGVLLYLINPQGHLQAILKPSQRKDGTLFFSHQKIYTDYRAIRNYFG